MAGKDLTISVSVKDGASSVLKQIGTSGKAAGTEVAAGATTASASLDKFNSAVEGAAAVAKEFATSSAGSFTQINTALAALGTDLGKLSADIKAASTSFDSFNKASSSVDRFEQAISDATTTSTKFDKTLDTASTSTEELSRAAATAAKNLDGIDRSMDQATTSARDFTAAGREIGLGLVGLGTAFTMYSRSVADNQTQLSTLERTYGEAADGLREYADQIQATTIFSNDAAVQATNVFGTLARNYGLTADQIKELVQISADLASANGVDLVYAAQAVSGAIRGEAEQAEQLGLTMNQAAIDAEGLTLTMSNAEAGQFRFAALVERSEFALGSAAEKANTTAGRFTQLGNDVQDAAQSFVSFTGPVGGAVAGLSTFGLEAGLAVTGLASLAKGFKSAVDAAGGMRAAMTGVAAFIGPGGAVAIGLGLAALAAYKFSESLSGDSLRGQMEQATESGKELDVTIAALTSTMSDAVLANDLFQGGQYLDEILAKYTEIAGFELKYPQGLPPGASQQAIDDYNTYIAAAERNQLLSQELITTYGSVEAAIGAVTTAENNYTAILKHHGAGQEEILTRLAEMNRDVARGFDDMGNAYTQNDFFADLQYITDNFALYDQRNQEAAASTQLLADAMAKLSVVARGDLKVAVADLIENGAPDELVDQWLELLPTLNTAMAKLASGLSGEDLGKVSVNLADLIDLSFTLEGPAGDYLDEALANLLYMLNSGLIDESTFALAIERLTNETLPRLDAEATIAFESVRRGAEGAAEAFTHAQKPLGELNEMIEKGAAAYTDYVQSVSSAARESGIAAIEQDKLNETLNRFNGVGEASTRTIDGVELSAAKLEDALLGSADGAFAAMATLEAFNAQFAAAKASIAGYSTELQQLQEMGFTGPELDLAINLQVSQGSLDTVFRSIVSQTDAMAQQLGSVDSWADKLIGDPGVWAEVDQLLADGRISQEQYNAAQEAQISISRDVENAQQDLLAIQTNLAPTIAEATRAQAEYIDELQDADTQTQLTALGLMDQATSTKALQLAQLSASVTTQGMAEDTAALVQAAADADPALRAVLQTMGLVDESGTAIVVDTSQADDAQNSMDELTASIDALTLALGGVPPIHVNYDDVGPARTEVQGLIDDLGVLDDSDANPRVTINNQATGELLAIAGQLLALPETKDIIVTTHHVSVYENRGDAFVYGATGLTMNEYATGGSMYEQFKVDLPHYATGGGHAIVGEYGPEMVWLPNGSQVTNHPATMSKLESIQKRRGGGDGAVNFYGPVTLQPASSNSYAAIRSAALSRSRR